MSRKQFILLTSALLLAITAVFALSLWLNRHVPEDSSFVGTDSAATAHIETTNPEYVPWFSPIFSPGSGEVESGLFALQAAIGAGVLGFAIGALWQRHRTAGGSIHRVADRSEMRDTQ